jgi:hypothetical protein
MADSGDRIQALRTKIGEIEAALNAFPRKADETADALRRAGFGQRLIASLRAGKMIRYVDEQTFSDLYQKVISIREDLNALEAALDEDDDEPEHDEDDEESDE